MPISSSRRRELERDEVAAAENARPESRDKAPRPPDHHLLEVQSRAGNRAAAAMANAQPKLVVGPVDDPYEREADAIATQLTDRLRTDDNAVEMVAPPVVQRRGVGHSAGGPVDSDVERQLDRTRGRGAELPSTAREHMEHAFDTDFSNVRVHTGSDATSLNDRLQAKAFTIGQDIFFRDRMPDVRTQDGAQLLAHELTHTIQQGDATDTAARTPLVIQRWNPFKAKKKDSDLSNLVVSAPRNGRAMGEQKTTSTAPQQPPTPTAEKKSKKKSKKDDLSNLVVSGPRNGRAMGEQKPQPVQKARPIPKYEFLKDPGRRAAFLEWVHQHPDTGMISDELIRVDMALSMLNDAAPSLGEAQQLVQILKSSSDPEVQKVVSESVKRFRDIATIDDNFVSEEQYRSKYGGLRQLQGIEGKLNYYTLDLYSGYQGSDAYNSAMAGPSKVPPPVPSREGRGQLSSPVVEDAPEPEGTGGKVSDLKKQLEGKLVFGLPGTKPQPSVHPSKVDVAPPQTPKEAKEQPVALAKREDPRQTERKMLDKLERGQKLSPDDLKLLSVKLGKGQTRSRGRDVTKTTEAEYAEIMSKLSKEQATELKRAINDYTQDSTAINTYARGINGAQDKKTNVDMIDKMFDLYDQKGFTQKNRISYRLSTYKPGQEMPYGTKIQVGDYIMDRAFVSASENRQLIARGPENKTKGARYVNFTIIGGGGANISGGSLYTNDNEKQMHKLHGSKKGKFTGPEAGQAEILFRRNSVFRIESITDDGENVNVVVIAVAPEEGQDKLKNSFNGQPTSIGKS